MQNAITATQQAINQVAEGTRNFHKDVSDFALMWVVSQASGTIFSSEDLRESFNARHNFKPNEPRVFGSVIRELAAIGLIQKAGFGTAKNVQSHCRPINLWKVV